MNRPVGRGRLVAMAALTVLVTLLAGCGDDDSEGMGDAPVRDRRGDNTPVEVINFPDHFGNVATKCVGPGYRAYTTTHFPRAEGEDFVPTNAHTAVVPDPTCA